KPENRNDGFEREPAYYPARRPGWRHATQSLRQDFAEKIAASGICASIHVDTESGGKKRQARIAKVSWRKKIVCSPDED
ncbi:MAG: hypothetical protein ACKO15_01050, partial [Burkholderiales bacterium]